MFSRTGNKTTCHVKTKGVVIGINLNRRRLFGPERYVVRRTVSSKYSNRAIDIKPIISI